MNPTSLSPGSAAGPAAKPRSCVVCRSRKVRCDKLSPCSNCRRAGIACVLPSTDRPPRWARRLQRDNNAGGEASSAPPAPAQVMERLRNLEGLVKDLSGQLEQANAAASSANASAAASNSPESSTENQKEASPGAIAGSIQKQFGRLVLKDANKSRYVSSGFWSRVNDELDELEIDSRGLGAGDSETSEDEASPGKSPSTQELERTPSERHGFLFSHNLSSPSPDLREFHPLPSQIPFLLDIFAENVNCLFRLVHMPTIAKLVRPSNMRATDMTSLSPANETLMFSIYYSAITSMEEEDVMANFGTTKTELNIKYRLGLEHALAQADFLNVPDLVLVQAFTIFLALLRRHDSPRFVWMMTGLAVRMGQALGLHRDGANFKHLTPFEIEMRRRAWWALCMLDVRSSEDQGTDFTISLGSYDTKFPLSINDADIDPETTVTPEPREGLTDMTIPLVQCEILILVKKIMALNAKDNDGSSIEEQNRLLNGIWETVDSCYLRYTSDSLLYWVQANVARLVIAKITLFIYLPALFSSPSERFSDEIKTKLLVAAIEIAEYNHVLNEEYECRHWRWIYQTYTHWYAVIYILIEVSRRPWSPIAERAWVALHSKWLISSQSHLDKTQRVWVPFRKLMAKARKHREGEIERLRNDPQAAERLEMEDSRLPVPGSQGPFPKGSNAVEMFRELWRDLLTTPQEQPKLEQTSPSAQSTYSVQQNTNSGTTYSTNDPVFNPNFDPAYLNPNDFQPNQNLSSNTSPNFQPPPVFPMDQNSYNVPTTWPGFGPLLWADSDPSVDVFADVNMDLDLDASNVDWYNWVESAKGMEFGG